MPITQEIRDVLDLRKLDLPPAPRVLAIDVEEYVDWSGDDSLRIWLTIAEDTDVDNLPGDAVVELKARIRDKLQSHGVELFAYISLAKPSELAEMEAEK